jgi:Tol biopolymer transport system component
MIQGGFMNNKNPCVWSIMLAALACTLLAFSEASTVDNNLGRIAFVLGPNIYSMKPDGSDVKQLTNLGSQNIAAFWESWSFDGSEIVFVESSSSFAPQLWLMNSDGTKQHQVFDDGNYQDYAPSFAPDGSHLIFTRCQPAAPNSCAIYRVNIDGTGLQTITHFSPVINEWEANYSPDGKRISFEAFELGGFLSAVYLMNPDGTGLQRITKPAPCAFDANWSPNSKKIAVSTHECNPQANQIWTMNADGSDITPLTNTGLPIVNGNSTWSPDGGHVAFERDNISKGTSAIFVISADGKEQTQLLEIPNTAKPSVLHYEITGLKVIAHRGPKRIEQGGLFPKWGSPPQ